MSINLRYQLGRLFRKCGYRLARDYRWPDVHGNLLVLGFALLRATRNGTIHVLQIGAFDGHACDPLLEVLQNENVSAILVEPQKIPYERLVERYANNPRVSLINAAVAEHDGVVKLYVPGSNASPMASLIAQHQRRFGSDAKNVRELEVPSISVGSLLNMFHGERLHLLQVDTEGMDYQILKWFFDAAVEPDVLNFESLHLSKTERLASRQLLNARGYWWIDSEQDTFALKESLVKTQQIEASN
jgi:FkbM family methyltransferase